MSFFFRAAVVGGAVWLVIGCARHTPNPGSTPVVANSVDHATMMAEQHETMHGSAPGSTGDTSFRALQERGKMAMGVDQYEATHHFDVLADGGRIVLEMKDDDAVAVAQIRAHLKLIQHAFQAGDFSTPEFVHMRAMPGTGVMALKKNVIAYTYADLPRGGEVRIRTADAEALAAIREFMSAQRGDHRAGGHDPEEK